MIYACIKLYLTIPVSTVEGERSFSVLKLLKTGLRSVMENDRLSDLAVIKMGNDVSIDFQSIVDEFAKLHSRHLDFF